MKKYKIGICMIILLVALSGCKRHIQIYDYEIDEFGNINSKISDCMMIDIRQSDCKQNAYTLQYYENCSIMEHDAGQVSQMFEIPKDDIYINNGIVYYNRDGFNHDTYVTDDIVTEERNNTTKEGFALFGEALKHLGVSIYDQYDTKVMMSENGHEIYYIKMYQEQNDLKIYEGVHGTFENRSMVYGPYIEIYFDKNNIYRLTINNVINIGMDNTEKKTVERTNVLDRIIYTYGRIISSDTYTIKNIEIQYTAFKESSGSMSLKPVWVVECEISQENGTVYSINILYDGYTGREVI